MGTLDDKASNVGIVGALGRAVSGVGSKLPGGVLAGMEAALDVPGGWETGVCGVVVEPDAFDTGTFEVGRDVEALEVKICDVEAGPERTGKGREICAHPSVSHSLDKGNMGSETHWIIQSLFL